DFFGNYSDSIGRQFTIAFSDGHFVKEAETKRWVDGKIVLLRAETFAWYKDIPRPSCAKVTDNGVVVACDTGYKTDYRLGGKLLVFDSKGGTLLQREFNFNLYDCNITSDGETCFV